AEPHLSPDDTPVSDWVGVAESLLGTPYLWGGNTSFGIDCSGLVVLAMRAAGRIVPRDSDLQEAAFPAAPASPQRGDLVFWRGHVGIMRDAETLLHANAHHMTVASEPLATAIDRIAQKEFGEVTKVARP
ncbi:MAG: NlpC/P60 family protein, partial [Pseudomonadota bacterium]